MAGDGGALDSVLVRDRPCRMDCGESGSSMEGRPEMRAFILFVFKVFFLFVAASAALAVVQALWAVSDYTVENPRVWVD